MTCFQKIAWTVVSLVTVGAVVGFYLYFDTIVDMRLM